MPDLIATTKLLAGGGGGWSPLSGDAPGLS